jgi:DNA polymerase III subunit alpha
MWLATYCSGEWYSAVLSHATGDVDLQRIMKTIKKRNLDVQVKPPRVNKSGIGYRFDKDENTIYIGLDMVKGIGPRSAGELLKITEEISSFRQFYKNKEYLKRIVNKKVVYTLIRVGFFDDINPDRNMVTAEFMQLHEKGYKKKEVDEIYEQELVENYGDLEFYKAEEAAFGMGFSPHPLTYMKKHINEIQDCLEEEQIAIACLVNKIQYKKTKKEKDYIFMNVDSPQVGSVGVFVWKGFEPYKKKIKEDTSLIMIVKPGWKDGMYDMHDAIDVSSGEVKVL